MRPGQILAARYIGAAGDHTTVYYESDDGVPGYYRGDGSAMERQFLAAPLNYSRISSNYSAARRHPILKLTRPHHGIDYAAPEGTPLWSVADGTVIYVGWGGGFGKLVKIRHNNGYVSYYGHLSSFTKGLHVGQQVEQKQTVGFVGHTGLATGPHVCFRVAKNGRYLNPRAVESPPGDPISESEWHRFQVARDALLVEMSGGDLLAMELSMDEAL